MFEKAGMRKWTASALSALALAGCTAKSPKPEYQSSGVPSINTPSGGVCTPKGVELNRSLQDKILQANEWLPTIPALPHTGNIVGVILETGDDIHPETNPAGMNRAQKLVVLFLQEYNQGNSHVAVQLVHNPNFPVGEARLTEYDGNCRDYVMGNPQNMVTQTA